MNITLRWGDRASFLGRNLRNSSRGHGSVVAIRGAMASGKTTLLHAFCDQAAKEGATVLAATASCAEECLQFGVVRQLLQHAPDPIRAAADARTRQLSFMRGADSEPGAHPDPSTVGVAYALGTELLSLAGDRPLVVAVDDAQFLDAASLQCVLVTARRAHSSRLLIVATNCICPHHGCRRFLAQIDRLPRVRQLRLERLTVADVEDALRERLGDAATTAVARSCHEIAGGNLLLVDALAQESAAAVRGDQVRVDPGRRFRDAVLACVGRCPPENLAVLHTTALLGETASTVHIAALVDQDRSAVASHLHALEAAGLLTKGRCHPAIVAAVTESMPTAQRQATHRRYAQLLYEENASATAIARQLIAAGLPPLPWATEVFCMAAGEEARDDPEGALRLLRAARRLTQDEDERARLTMLLASLGWRTNPGAVRRYLPELAGLLRHGRLGRADAELTIRYLLWSGRADDAADALGRLLASVPPGRAVELRPFVLWLSIWYPGVVHRIPAAEELRSSEALRSEVVGAQPVSAGKVFDLILGNGERWELAAEAGRLLESWRLTDQTMDALVTALVGLLAADELDCALRWCDVLTREALAHGARLWHAQLTSLRAEIAYRQGKIDVAAEYAASAYAQVPAEDWGVWVGLPLSTLVWASTVLGEYDRAAEVLDKPVPAEMFETTIGMLYLQARGQYLLATGDPQRARVEFQACWDFMRRRGVDLPNILPWRIRLAEAHLRLGMLGEARGLAKEQITICAGRGHWARGIALRLMAGASGPEHARALLERSVQELDGCGAQLELAWTLTDLARCYQDLGESARAAHTEHQARLIATACGAARLPDAARDSGNGELTARSGRAAQISIAHRLSAAERRVAAQVVKGLSNLQIAHRLYLTVSTVEQHLTHIYRKLNINGRSELASVLDLPAADLPEATPRPAARAVPAERSPVSAVGSQ